MQGRVLSGATVSNQFSWNNNSTPELSLSLSVLGNILPFALFSAIVSLISDKPSHPRIANRMLFPSLLNYYGSAIKLVVLVIRITILVLRLMAGNVNGGMVDLPLSLKI